MNDARHSDLPAYIRSRIHRNECLRGFVEAEIRVSYQQFRDVARGHHKAGTKFLNALNNYHCRLFPTEPVLLLLPNQPPVLLGHYNHSTH